MVVVDVIHVLEWMCLMWAREELLSSPRGFILIFPLRLCICTALTFQRGWTNGSCKISACVSSHMYFHFVLEKKRISLLWCKQYILKCWSCYVMLCYVMFYVLKSWILIYAKLVEVQAFSTGFGEGSLDLSHWFSFKAIVSSHFQSNYI